MKTRLDPLLIAVAGLATGAGIVLIVTSDWIDRNIVPPIGSTSVSTTAASKVTLTPVDPNEKYYCVAPRLVDLQKRDGRWDVKADPEFAATHMASELWWLYNPKLGKSGCGVFGGTLVDAVEHAIGECSPEAIAKAEEAPSPNEPPKADPATVKRFTDKVEKELDMCLKLENK